MQFSDCPRGRTDCVPLSNQISCCGTSFICVGYNSPEDRGVDGDRFTHCWKNDAVDERGHWDRRDLIDTVMVMTQALSIDENIRVSEGMTDDEMNECEFVGGDDESA